jgi:hypothetical protein
VLRVDEVLGLFVDSGLLLSDHLLEVVEQSSELVWVAEDLGGDLNGLEARHGDRFSVGSVNLDLDCGLWTWTVVNEVRYEGFTWCRDRGGEIRRSFRQDQVSCGNRATRGDKRRSEETPLRFSLFIQNDSGTGGGAVVSEGVEQGVVSGVVSGEMEPRRVVTRSSH